MQELEPHFLKGFSSHIHKNCENRSPPVLSPTLKAQQTRPCAGLRAPCSRSASRKAELRHLLRASP